jgi:hypothetical protein
MTVARGQGIRRRLRQVVGTSSFWDARLMLTGVPLTWPVSEH